MERLYFIKHAVATEETGPYCPQIERLSPESEYDAKDSIYRLFDSFHDFPESSPKIDFASLKKGSKLTDLLSSSMFVLLGFLVSQKLRNLLERFQLPSHRFYSVPVKSEKTTAEYFWMHMIYQYSKLSVEEAQNKHLIFNLSHFIVENHLSRVSDISVSSAGELLAKEKELGYDKSIKATSITLNEDFLKDVPDLFKIPLISNNWIIKQRLRDEIVREKITGVSMTEVENINFQPIKYLKK